MPLRPGAMVHQAVVELVTNPNSARGPGALCHDEAKIPLAQLLVLVAAAAVPATFTEYIDVRGTAYITQGPDGALGQRRVTDGRIATDGT